MKKYFVFLLLIGVVSIALIALADNPPQKPTPTADVQALKNQLAELQARVQALETETKTLESTVHTMQQPHLIPLLRQPEKPLSFGAPSSSDSQQPKIWGQGKVNGWTFYIVPCEQGQ